MAVTSKCYDALGITNCLQSLAKLRRTAMPVPVPSGLASETIVDRSDQENSFSFSLLILSTSTINACYFSISSELQLFEPHEKQQKWMVQKTCNEKMSSLSGQATKIRFGAVREGSPQKVAATSILCFFYLCTCGFTAVEQIIGCLVSKLQWA